MDNIFQTNFWTELFIKGQAWVINQLPGLIIASIVFFIAFKFVAFSLRKIKAAVINRNKLSNPEEADELIGAGGCQKKPGLQFKNYFDPGAAATIRRASVRSGRSSAGIPITISPSSIPENLRDPSHPSEKFTRPLR